MRQGIIIFASTPAPGSADETALRAAVAEALATPEATPFVAYANPEESTALRAVIGGPPPRFFPQANRATLGERIAQALAFLFVQGYDHVVVLTRPQAIHQVGPALAALNDESVAIRGEGEAYAVAVQRPEFPRIAPIFEGVAWEEPGAAARAAKLLDENGAKA